MSACNKYTSMQDLVLGLVKFSTKEVHITFASGPTYMTLYVIEIYTGSRA